MSNKPPLLIPVENQVRELDSKLLLAVVAAQAGYKSYLGYRTEMDIVITSLPKGIYLAKSFTARSDKMFRILTKLGHTICAWDEEALVHYPPDIYFSRRLSAKAMSYITHLFAWGEENAKLFRAYPELPKDLPIHNVGNPRLDLLREEFTHLYSAEIEKIKNEYGNFILLNTNFGNVNAHLPIHNLFINKDAAGNYKDMGKGAVGMGHEFANGRAQYKQALFDKFVKLIEHISQKKNDFQFVIRPHPVENQNIYEQFAKKFPNVRVAREGNVIPWIHAAEILIHSGCTTGIEAYLCHKPAIAYVPIEDDRFGYDAILPNLMSIQCPTEDDVLATIDNIESKRKQMDQAQAIAEYISLNDHKLCCSNIIAELDAVSSNLQPNQNIPSKMHGWYLANKRKATKRVKSLMPNSKYNRAFQEVRFPTLELSSLQNKAGLFAEIIGAEKTPTIKAVSDHIFLVQ